MNTISRAAYDGNIVSRLRNWRGLHLAHSGDLFEEAAAEIERLRGDADITRLRLEAAHAEIARLRNQVEQLRSEVADAKKWAMQERSQRWALPEPLTDAERKAFKTVIGGFGMWVAQNGLTDDESLRLAVVTLRGLLERMGRH